jgi:hypothetical protein
MILDIGGSMLKLNGIPLCLEGYELVVNETWLLEKSLSKGRVELNEIFISSTNSNMSLFEERVGSIKNSIDLFCCWDITHSLLFLVFSWERRVGGRELMLVGCKRLTSILARRNDAFVHENDGTRGEFSTTKIPLSFQH